MADPKKTIQGLECHINEAPYDCPYGGNPDYPCANPECEDQLLNDALSLLKVQEPKKLRCIRRLTKVMKGICPVCEMEIESVIHGRITKFCKFCGQAVKWE